MLAAGRFRRALNLLMKAGEYARRVAGDPWDFAVDIQQFRRFRLTENDLRFLVRMKYLDHARESTTSSDAGRVFRSTGSVSFTKRTCFVLTPLGMAVAENVAMAPANGQNHIRERAGSLVAVHQTTQLPFWDSNCRVLSFAGLMVKQFRRRALNQELVLAAFEEESWPRRIDDPLTPQPCQDMKRRLNDTIKCLNRGQQDLLLHFRGDGTGEGVLWEVVGKSTLLTPRHSSASARTRQCSAHLRISSVERP